MMHPRNPGVRGRRALIMGAVLAAAACASAPKAAGPLAPGSEVVTTKNLHPDEVHARLYAVNYQQDGLLPVCTKVRIDKLTPKAMIFTVLDTGKRYTYLHHKVIGEPFYDHLARYFGTECPDTSGLPASDQKGIGEGHVAVGMTKGGVKIAIGLPPPHGTPSLDGSRWKYWKNRFDTFVVVFDGTGTVTAIED